MTHDHDHGWQHELLALRAEATHYFKHGFDWRGQGPPDDFEGPRYYPPAGEWQVEAWVDQDVPGAGDEVELATSTGKLRRMKVEGQLVFAVDGREHRLTAFRSAGGEDGDMLFVPFQDATSGGETYGAGRYLDLPVEESGNYLLDFNYAYNPSCAYSPAYDCPFPPPGNRLDIAVTAGEQVPFEH